MLCFRCEDWKSKKICVTGQMILTIGRQIKIHLKFCHVWNKPVSFYMSCHNDACWMHECKKCFSISIYEFWICVCLILVHSPHNYHKLRRVSLNRFKMTNLDILDIHCSRFKTTGLVILKLVIFEECLCMHYIITSFYQSQANILIVWK